MRRLITAAATLATVLGALLVPAVTAGATTTACTTGVLGAYCGTQADGNQLAVAASGTPATNRAVIAAPDAATTATDFAWFVPAGNFPTGSKQVMITPGGKLSGYCLSDPDQVYAGHASRNAIVDRPCTGNNPWQTWTFNGTGWTNRATGLVLTEHGSGHQLTDAAAVTGDPAQSWSFSG